MKKMRRTLLIFILGIMLLAIFSISFQEITHGDEGSDVGRIYGYTYEIIGWQTLSSPFALVQAGSEQDISDIYGYYELNDLPLDQVYALTANKIGYLEEHITVNLTYEEPEIEVNILLTLKDPFQPLSFSQIILDKLYDELSIVNMAND